ncbi:hypothetical protein ACFL96_13350 [Thermoproteota archaeon]
MKKTLYPILCLFMLILLLSAVSGLETIASDEIIITTEKDENLLATGGKIVIDAPVEGDLMVGGGELIVNAPVNGDIMAGAGKITINEKVTGDLRLGGGDILILGDVEGDILSGSGNIVIKNDHVSGDIAISAGNAEIYSDVSGSVDFEGGSLLIDGTVTEDVNAEAKTINLSDNVLIKGDLNYKSKSEISLNQDQVEGSITRSKKAVGKGWFSKIFGKIYLITVLFILGLILLYTISTASQKVANIMNAYPIQSLLVGLVTLILTPIIAIILLVTVIGILFGVALLLLYAFAVLLSMVYFSIYLGAQIFRLFKKEVHPAVELIVGLVVFVILAIPPVIGGIIIFLAIIFGLGGIALALFMRKPVFKQVIKKKSITKKTVKKRRKKKTTKSVKKRGSKKARRR